MLGSCLTLRACSGEPAVCNSSCSQSLVARSLLRVKLTVNLPRILKWRTHLMLPCHFLGGQKLTPSPPRHTIFSGFMSNAERWARPHGQQLLAWILDSWWHPELLTGAMSCACLQVRMRFEATSLEMWAIGNRAYRLYVPKLYGTIVPSKCKLRVKQHKATLQLRKTSDAEWRFLRG